MSTVLYILLAIVIFGVLIAVHEGGHFIAARLCGVRVLEFSLGMGPRLWHRTDKKGTEVSLRLLPIGGFCAMEGEDEASDDPKAFTNAAAWKRLIILVAGAGMNFLMGLVIILAVFAKYDTFSTPEITGFMAGCPYEGEDGLMAGDVFYEINGERIYVASDVSTYLARRTGDTSDIVVIRDGKKVALKDYPMVPVEYEVEREDPETGGTVTVTERFYGLTFGKTETGFAASLKYSWYQAKDFVRMVRLGLTDLITGAVGVKQMSGVVGIVAAVADVGNASATVSAALWSIAFLTAFIAVNLAVVNLLPLPALDGGRVFLLIVTWLIEHVFRRKVPPKYEAYIHTAGLVALLGLMVYVMYNDIARIVGG